MKKDNLLCLSCTRAHMENKTTYIAIMIIVIALVSRAVSKLEHGVGIDTIIITGLGLFTAIVVCIFMFSVIIEIIGNIIREIKNK